MVLYVLSPRRRVFRDEKVKTGPPEPERRR